MLELYERFFSDLEELFDAYPDKDVVKNMRYYHLREDAPTPDGVLERSRWNNIRVMQYVARNTLDRTVAARARRTAENLRKQDDKP